MGLSQFNWRFHRNCRSLRQLTYSSLYSGRIRSLVPLVDIPLHGKLTWVGGSWLKVRHRVNVSRTPLGLVLHQTEVQNSTYLSQMMKRQNMMTKRKEKECKRQGDINRLTMTIGYMTRCVSKRVLRTRPIRVPLSSLANCTFYFSPLIIAVSAEYFASLATCGERRRFKHRQHWHRRGKNQRR